MRRAACVAIAVVLLRIGAQVVHSQKRTVTLAQVRSSGVLRCGIDVEQAEYSTTDDHGNRAAFDADLCKAVAVAVLGGQAHVTIKTFPDDAGAVAALKAGDVDMIPTLADDFSHAAGAGLAFTRPVLWDGVGFLALHASGIAHASQLSGKKICFLAETGVEDVVRSWFARERLDFVAFPFQEEGEMQAAFATGNCGALAGERTRLAQTRAALAQHSLRTRLLPEAISSDPLAAAVRDDDPQWFSIVNWVMESLVAAEENGVTKPNVMTLHDRAAQDLNPQRRFLLGGSQQIGSSLGLDNDWVARIIAATGNYGEIYERGLGVNSPLKLPRGINKLHRDGGVMVSLPAR
jgi:general L-amino acid transport system substrate-binding protein